MGAQVKHPDALIWRWPNPGMKRLEALGPDPRPAPDTEPRAAFAPNVHHMYLSANVQPK
jgi:hypothetical protein